ncbi:MAG: response regulator, partial [Bryobacter sp.]|nr:response regulator [Bryobacter sp. CoA8 C33]MBZ2186154.1 response regulator [Bryobacter sp. CoA8 C33]
ASHTPIVALTAHAVVGYKERCIAAGMNDFVTKPVQVQQLFEVIHRLTAGDISPNSLAADTLDPVSTTS